MIKDVFNFTESTTHSPSNDFFQLHTHEWYEVLLFLEGDSQYIIEGRTYSLDPFDIIVIRHQEMHRIYHNSNADYKRILLTIYPRFFKTYHCELYEKQFKDTVSCGNKINAAVVKSSGIYDSFFRLRKYYNNHLDMPDAPVIIASIIELLYLLQNASSFAATDYTHSAVSSIISYLNNNYMNDINLDLLSKKFYLSKYYICREFKKTTGLTINKYMRRKRLAKFKELQENGLSVIDAALEVGFHSYNSFYNAYISEFGVSPRNKTKQ